MSAAEDRLLAVATCLCAEIAANTTTPDTCFCGVVPGEAAAWDYAGDCSDKCGTAWVRLVNAYPSTIVGEPTAQPGNCSAILGLDIEVGIVRCTPGPDSDGTPPSADVLLAATIFQVEDMLTMRRAILCCAGSSGFLLGPYTPVGPQGGLVGGVWTFSTHEF